MAATLRAEPVVLGDLARRSAARPRRERRRAARPPTARAAPRAVGRSTVRGDQGPAAAPRCSRRRRRPRPAPRAAAAGGRVPVTQQPVARAAPRGRAASRHRARSRVGQRRVADDQRHAGRARPRARRRDAEPRVDVVAVEPDQDPAVLAPRRRPRAPRRARLGRASSGTGSAGPRDEAVEPVAVGQPGHGVQHALVEEQRAGRQRRARRRARRAASAAAAARGDSASQCASGSAASASANVGRSSPLPAPADQRGDLAVELDGREQQHQVALERREAEPLGDEVDGPASPRPGAARRAGPSARSLLEQRAGSGRPRPGALGEPAPRRSGAGSRAGGAHAGTVTVCEGSNDGGSGRPVDEQALDPVDGEPHPLGAVRHDAELEGERRGRRSGAGRRARRRAPSASVARWLGRTRGRTSSVTVTLPVVASRVIVGAGASTGVGASSIAATFVVRATVSPGRTRSTVTVQTPAGHCWRRSRRSAASRRSRCGSVLAPIVTLCGVVEQPVARTSTSTAVPSRWWPSSRTVSPSRAAGCSVGRGDALRAWAAAAEVRLHEDPASRRSGRPAPDSTGSAAGSACAPRSARPRRGRPRSAGSAPGSPTTAATSPRCPSARASP